MTRDERMAKLLDCVDFYAHSKTWDHGRKAKAILALIAEDERVDGMNKERKKEQARAVDTGRL